MLSTGYEIIDEVLVRANATTTATSGGLYTDTNLRSWLNNAHKWSGGFRKWPVTEGRNTTTYSSEEYSYFEGWKPDSIRYLDVGGKRLQKVSFSDYQIYRENESSGQDKIFTDFGLTYFINPQADVSGTITAYGQFTPANIDTTDDTATTVFSANLPEANEAIVEEMLKYAKQRENKQDEARLHHARAIEILSSVFDSIKDEGFGYHSHGRGMWERFDVLEGGFRDDLVRRDQFGF